VQSRSLILNQSNFDIDEKLLIKKNLHIKKEARTWIELDRKNPIRMKFRKK